MRRGWIACALSAATLGACGLESVLTNAGHDQYERPASKISGTLPEGVVLANVSVIDGDGNVVTPFQATATGHAYELRLPSSKYSMHRVRAVAGNLELRTIVPFVGEESAVTGVNLDARNMTETLIAEARIVHDGDTFKKVTPDAYLGTRKLIRDALDAPGPTQELLNMVTLLLTKFDPSLSQNSPDFFNPPVLSGAEYTVNSSPLDPGYIARNPFDYVGDGKTRRDSADFDSKLAQVAKLYRPAGCPDPARIRMVFTVDFNEGGHSGNCGSVDRFKWAKDKPGKSMFFVGWIYDGSAGLTASDITDPAVAKLLGNSNPNTIPMYDDGTNGDQTAGDNVWTITFDVPRASAGKVLRIGYKYTWGTSGSQWSGSEEWPGNSRILEVVDDSGDELVYRRDVFGDEATNKDKSNSNISGAGVITFKTDLHGCGTPEAHENMWDNKTCKCGSVPTPKWIGPLTVTCTQ